MKNAELKIKLENTLCEFPAVMSSKEAIDRIAECTGWQPVAQYVAQQGLVATAYIFLSAHDFEREIQRAIQNELEKMRDSAFFGVDFASKDSDRTEYLDANP